MLEEYNELLARAKEIKGWGSINALLGWDFETYMPSGATNQRSYQLSLIKSLIHKKMTDPEIANQLEKIMASAEYNEMSAVEKRNIYLIKKAYDEQTKLPPELVEKIARQYAIATATWKKAKKNKDYSIFKPELQITFDLIKEKAKYLNPDKKPYDVLLDLYEPGISREIIQKLFDPLKKGLIPLIKKCVEADQVDLSFLQRKVPIDIQRKISAKLMDFLEYDLQYGRLDETEHPFTTGIYDDVRICTHYFENNSMSSFYSVLHEAGHAIYEQNLPEAWRWMPVGEMCSMGIHESQSRVFENIIGRSEEFWKYFLPIFKNITGKTFEDIDLSTMLRAVNNVKPSKIRIEADEVTYSLHVILRFEIEQMLFADQVSISELPQVWNEKMDEYFGLQIEHDSEGVMQDTHWAIGAFGYFPDYVLGNIYDGMFLEKLGKEHQGWLEEICNGSINTILNWMIDNVHHNGNLMDPVDLVKHVTGKDINSRPFISYLEEKMKKIYNF